MIGGVTIWEITGYLTYLGSPTYLRLEQALFITEEEDKLYHQVCSLLVMDSWSYMASTFHFAAPETSYDQPLTMTKFSLYLL